MNFRLTIPKSLNGIIQWQSSSSYPYQTEESKTDWFALIGHIYSPTSKSPGEWHSTFSELRDLKGLPKGRYLFLHLDKQTSKLQIWADKYRLLGTFCIQANDCWILSNDQGQCATEFHNSEPDRIAFQELLNFGYVIPPRTLFTDTKMLAGFTELRLKTSSMYQIDWCPLWPNSNGTTSPSTDKLVELLSESANNLVSTWNLKTFRISGGVDTRLVIALLNESSKARLKFEVVCSPFLSDQEDRDVLGALAVTKALNVPLEILRPDPEIYAYFTQMDDSQCTLSGLGGGEFLGGVMLSDVPGVTLHARTATLASVYLNAFRSAIYQSVQFGWSQPQGLGQLALSPFTESDVLDYLLSIPPEELVDYRFYKKLVLKHMPAELLAIPFSSPIVEFGLLPFSNGVDPKEVRKPKSEVPVSKDFIDYLSSLGVEMPSHLVKARLMGLMQFKR